MSAILLDLDGVLIDSWRQVEQSLLAAAEEIGFDCMAGLPGFRARMGMPLETIVAELGWPVQIVERFRRAARLRDRHVRPFEGVPAMLVCLRAFGLRIGVVTGKDRPRTLAILQTAGLARLVDSVITADDAPGKPRPDGLWECERRLGAGSALAYIGDTAVDVAAAENAGRLPVLATWGGGPRLPSRAELIELADPAEAVALVADLVRPPIRRAGR
ncbi:MAG: HAD family hydrolase [Pseudolabrys sp.]